MHYRKSVVISLVLLTATVITGTEKYAHPALNPVKFTPPSNTKSITLIQDGKLQFAIVCDLSAETGEAAKRNFITRSRRSVALALEGLQHAFHSVCGQRAPVLKPDSPQLKNFPCWIVLGDNALSRKLGLDPAGLEPDEFRVFTFDRGVVIAGYDGSTRGFYNALDPSKVRVNGTAYGVYDFCERFLGMRYYYPRIGIYAPTLKDLTIDPVSYSDKPYIKYHFSYALNSRNLPGKQQLSDFSPAWRNGSSSRYSCGHTPDPHALAKAYPDKINMLFYQSKGGRFYYNPLAHIGNYYDVTNPAFIDFLVDELAAKFYAGDPLVRKIWSSGQQPNSEYIPFGQSDTYLSELDNERSKPWQPESTRHLRHGSLSDLYAHFNNELARKINQRFPGKKLATSVYHSRTLPPVGKFDWQENLRLKICMGCPVMAKSPEFQKAWKKVFSGWHKTTGRPSAGYCYGVRTYAFTAAIQGRYMGDFIRTLGPDLWRDHLFFDAGHNHRFYYSYYPAYRSIWNPEFNVQVALDEHWELLYGPRAGKLLKTFYDLLVERWEKHLIPQLTDISVDYSIRGNITPKQLYQAFDLKTIDRLDGLLKKARQAVKPGSIEAQRLDFFLGPWADQFQTARAYHKTRTPFYRIARLNPGEKIAIDGNADEPAWKRAAVCRMKDSCGLDREIPEQPETRMLWDDRGIYLLFTAQGKPVRNPGEIWKHSDALEFFLSPGLKRQVFFQFAFDPDGDLYQGTRDLVEGMGGALKCPGLQLKSVYSDHHWQAELFVPFSGIGQKTPAPYDVWFGNMVYAQRRTVTADNRSASFAFTMRNTHNTDLWGQFRFMGWGD